MKRITCLALVLVLFFQILVIPAAAVDPLTGIIVTASAATVIGSALIGLGLSPGTDGSVFDGIVSGAADYLASIGFGDGVGFPVLKYLGTGGVVRYALETAAMTALRSWVFDQSLVEFSQFHIFSPGTPVSVYYHGVPTVVTFPEETYAFKLNYHDLLYEVIFGLTRYGLSGTTADGSTIPVSDFSLNMISFWVSCYSSPFQPLLNPSITPFFDVDLDWPYELSSISDAVRKVLDGDVPPRSFDVLSSYDVSIGDVAAPDTSLAVGYPNWAIDSVQVDPGDGDDPIPYVPIGLDDRYDGITQEDVQSGESTLETPNEGTEVTISGDVGGSLTPDGGGSGDLPGGEGSVTVDDLTTMFAWLAVRIDEAVASLFPDLQVIKTYLKSIAQWHETENVKYDSMLSYFSGWDADIDTMLTTVSNIDLNLTTLVYHAATSSDTLAAIAADVQDIRDVIADPLDADINEEEQDNKNAFLNTFSKKSQAKNITDLSGFSDGFSDWFDLPDVSIGGFFDQLETGVNPWFTSETQQAISVGGGPISSGAALMSEDLPATPYLDAWDLEVQSILNGGHDDG